MTTSAISTTKEEKSHTFLTLLPLFLLIRQSKRTQNPQHTTKKSLSLTYRIENQVTLK